jgi:hypothetical protein
MAIRLYFMLPYLRFDINGALRDFPAGKGYKKPALAAEPKGKAFHF